MPLWYLTGTPVTATLLVTAIDGLGFFPSFRKAYEKPYQESAFLFSVYVLTGFLRLLAVEHFSFTTLFYPVSIMTMNLAFTLMIVWRRRLAAAAS